MTKNNNRAEDQIKVSNGKLRIVIGIGISPQARMGLPYYKLVTSNDLGGRSQVRLQKLIRNVELAIEDMETVRKKLLDQYAKKDDNKELVLEPPKDEKAPSTKAPKDEKAPPTEVPRDRWIYAFDGDNREKFETAWNDVLNEDAEILSKKPSLKEAKYPINPFEMASLSDLINFEE